MSDLLWDLRIEDLNNSMLFDDDGNQIPVDFIDKVLDDPEHQKAIKERLRMSVLDDVTANPQKYVEKRTGEDTREYVYSSDVYDHAYLVDNYVEDQYADTQTRTVYICSHCNSDNVQVKAWVRPNQGMLYVDEVNEGDEMGWCDDCNLSAVIETAEVKRRANVIGFQVISDDDKIDMHPHMDASFCLYSLDQARSMMDDDNNGDEQWKLLAIWTDDVEEPTMMFETDPRDPDEETPSDGTIGTMDGHIDPKNR